MGNQATKSAEEAKELEDIEAIYGSMFCQMYYVHLCPRDAMATACETSPRVRRWWEHFSGTGRYRDISEAWSEIKAIMDSRAALRSIEVVANTDD